jgi:hypothetical protein
MYTGFLLKLSTSYDSEIKNFKTTTVGIPSIVRYNAVDQVYMALVRHCKFVVVLNGCFCYFDHMCTCLF